MWYVQYINTHSLIHNKWMCIEYKGHKGKRARKSGIKAGDLKWQSFQTLFCMYSVVLKTPEEFPTSLKLALFHLAKGRFQNMKTFS